MDWQAKYEALLAAVQRHHGQKADDRCQLDDDELYAAAGLPPVDRRVGDKFAMLMNCGRFIERRCEGGIWPSYALLEDRLAKLVELLLDDVAEGRLRQEVINYARAAKALLAIPTGINKETA